MKTAVIATIGVLALGGSLFLQRAAGSMPINGEKFNREFTGEITDSLCAENSSHIGAMKNNWLNPAAACVRACVKFDGAQFVLYDKQARRTYKLDDQEQPDRFAGQRVAVTGFLDEETGTIHVNKIRPLIENAL
jgi:uncharacterized protein DUF5818